MTQTVAGPPQFSDNPKADQAAAKAYAKAQRPLWKKKRVIIPAAFVVIAIAASTSGGGSDTTTIDTASGDAPVSAPKAPEAKKEAPAAGINAEANTDAAKNVTLDSCKVDTQFGMATVGYTIDNPTSKSSMYLLDIKVIDSTGAAVGTANGIENNVLPGRPSKGEAVGSVSDSAVAPFTCEVGEVTRMAS